MLDDVRRKMDTGTTSQQNHRDERIWPEVNAHVNYPIKAILISLEEDELIDMSNELHKFCVSWVTIQVIAPAVTTFVSSWNSHVIPGRNGGVPIDLANRAQQIGSVPSTQVPTVCEAVVLHEAAGGHLTRESTYGCDPIAENPQLQQLRKRDFFAAYSSMERIFSDVLHNRGMMLKEAIATYIQVTHTMLLRTDYVIAKVH